MLKSTMRDLEIRALQTATAALSLHVRKKLGSNLPKKWVFFTKSPPVEWHYADCQTMFQESPDGPKNALVWVKGKADIAHHKGLTFLVEVYFAEPDPMFPFMGCGTSEVRVTFQNLALGHPATHAKYVCGKDLPILPRPSSLSVTPTT